MATGFFHGPLMPRSPRSGSSKEHLCDLVRWANIKHNYNIDDQTTRQVKPSGARKKKKKPNPPS